jgi:hypothetical protein
LPGRQRHRLAEAGRARAAFPGQGPHCNDLNLSRVPCVKFRTWLL